MSYKSLLLSALCLAGFYPAVSASERDKPFHVESDVSETFENSIAECIQKAMKSLPPVKSRFMAGLPATEALYLTIRIAGKDGKIEQVFVRVNKWDKYVITGTLANHLRHAGGYEPGDTLKFGEGDILDWTMRKADGSCEGNFIGKFVSQWLGGATANTTAPASTAPAMPSLPAMPALPQAAGNMVR